MYFAPESNSDTADQNGELTLGGTDSSKYAGSVSYVPTINDSSFGNYWGLTVDGVSYDSSSLLGSNGAIVDTGPCDFNVAIAQRLLTYIPQRDYANLSCQSYSQSVRFQLKHH